FANQIERERRMRGIAQWIKTGKHVQRNARIGMPDVRLWDGQEFRKRALAIHSDAFRVGAKMASARKTIAAMAAHDMTFTRNKITRRETLHSIPDALDNADVFVPDYHRYRDSLLRPRIPVVNVDVSAANRSLLDADEHIIVAHFRYRHFLEPKARLS